HAITENIPSGNAFKFSREPVCATIDSPDLGEVMVYVTHLKSKRPIVDRAVEYQDDMPWKTRFKDTLLRRSRGDVLSMLQRGLEATALYHDVVEQLSTTPQIVVMGDINDDESSSPFNALTQQQKVFEVGGIEDEAWPQEDKRELHEHQLFDCFIIAPNVRSKTRPYTHLYRGHPNVLDHILVSNALNPRNNEASGEVCHYEVFNHHIRNDDVDNKLQSDHGQVCIEILPCEVPDNSQQRITPVQHKPKRIWTNQCAESDKERLKFIELAGGVYQSRLSYRQFKSNDKWAHFWSFFFDTNHGWVKSVYGSIPVDTLVQKKRHTIEHIVPRSFLQEYMISKRIPRNVRFGADTNPLNWVPADRTLNSQRSSFQFDFNDDKVIRPREIYLNPDAYSSTGIDGDEEWVVPTRSRGDIARAILYMLLVYEIDELYIDHIKTLSHWAKTDQPADWEKAYNEWVYEQHGIRNPLISHTEQSLEWLESGQLLEGLLCKNYSHKKSD
ncbi:MAG: endonuclease, partial [Leucothrix sp.]